MADTNTEPTVVPLNAAMAEVSYAVLITELRFMERLMDRMGLQALHAINFGGQEAPQKLGWIHV